MTASTVDRRLVDPEPRSRHPAGLMVVIGTLCIVAGGLVAAVTGPLNLADGSWLAAYLVLVGGVAQCAFGLTPSRLTARPASRRLLWTQLGCWNAGNGAIIAGTLTNSPVLVDIGALLLVIGLATAWHAVRHTARSSRTARLAGRAYRWLLLALLISIPVGAALAHLRSPA